VNISLSLGGTLMLFKTRVDRLVGVLVGGVLVVASSAAIYSDGRPHPPTSEESANNLSVPTIFVPGCVGSPFTGTCTEGDDSQNPSGPLGVDTDGNGLPDEHLNYYVQGVASWQSDCDEAPAGTIEVAAAWGDNLTNAPLKAGTPIRVEIGFLTFTEYSMPGFDVSKLDQTLSDRESHYGTLGEKVADFGEVRVWDSAALLDIRSTDGTVVVQNMQPFTAEINSTGRIVYGFNWQNPMPGEYTITVVAPQVMITSADAGTVVTPNIVSLDLTVGNKGGGKGNGGRPGGVGPGKGRDGNK